MKKNKIKLRQHIFRSQGESLVYLDASIHYWACRLVGLIIPLGADIKRWLCLVTGVRLCTTAGGQEDDSVNLRARPAKECKRKRGDLLISLNYSLRDTGTLVSRCMFSCFASFTPNSTSAAADRCFKARSFNSQLVGFSVFLLHGGQSEGGRKRAEFEWTAKATCQNIFFVSVWRWSLATMITKFTSIPLPSISPSIHV